MTSDYVFGFGRSDITLWEPEISMLGWGQYHNRVEGVAAPLHARALYLRDQEGNSLAYVCCDLLLVSEAVRRGVLQKLATRPELGLDDHGVVLTATHTHSGPSGYSHYFWKNLASPGFSQVVYDGLVNGIVDAILDAWKARGPGKLKMASERLPTADGITFNRSWEAYSQNPEVEPVTKERRHEATDRLMTVLRFETEEGTGIGALVFFAVHGTCVHSDNTQLHPDNKGLAAVALEESGEDAPQFAIFAQEAAGDVSPNYRWDAKRGVTVGKYDDDFQSAEYVANVQARYARKLWDRAADAEPLTGPVDGVVHHVDFSKVDVDPAVVPGPPGRRTRLPRVGISMAQGTAEGPGPLREARWVCRLMNGLAGIADTVKDKASTRYQRRHDPKFPLLELGKGRKTRLAGLLPLNKNFLPSGNPALNYARQLLDNEALEHPELIPLRIPVQLVRIGPIAIAATSFEVTTVSGRRLRSTLEASLREEGIETIIINPYANSYTGYLTTFEEYQVQAYEGGYTLFGPWSLAALRTIYHTLASELGQARELRSSASRPWPVPIDEVLRRQYEARWPDLRPI